MKALRAAALLAVGVAACDEAPDAGPMAASASGTGTVTAVDAPAGTITLAHGAMPEIGWPAMTMTFSAAPDLLGGVREGDTVAFELALVGGRAEITALD